MGIQVRCFEAVPSGAGRIGRKDRHRPRPVCPIAAVLLTIDLPLRRRACDLWA